MAKLATFSSKVQRNSKAMPAWGSSPLLRAYLLYLSFKSAMDANRASRYQDLPVRPLNDSDSETTLCDAEWAESKSKSHANAWPPNWDHLVEAQRLVTAVVRPTGLGDWLCEEVRNQMTCIYFSECFRSAKHLLLL